MSWKSEIRAVGERSYSSNACRYATQAEADMAGRELSCRWYSVEDWRSAQSDDPVNYRFDLLAMKNLPLTNEGVNANLPKQGEL